MPRSSRCRTRLGPVPNTTLSSIQGTRTLPVPNPFPTPGCSDAALAKLSELLDATGVPANRMGNAAEHELAVIRVRALVEQDEPGLGATRVKLKVEALNVELMDEVAVIWLTSKASGQVLAACRVPRRRRPASLAGAAAHPSLQEPRPLFWGAGR